MNPSFSITIPKPCHEDWNKMTPDQKGAFCGSCQKSVYDFTKKTDEEVSEILLKSNGSKICGRFNAEQLERPIDLNVPIYDLPRNVSPMRAFAMAAFLIFGTMLFTCETSNGQQVGQVKFIPETQIKNNPVMGGPKYTPKTAEPGEGKTKTGKVKTVTQPKENYALMGDVVCEYPVKGEMVVKQIPPVTQDSAKPKTIVPKTHVIKKDSLIKTEVLMGKVAFNAPISPDTAKPRPIVPTPPVVKDPEPEIYPRMGMIAYIPVKDTAEQINVVPVDTVVEVPVIEEPIEIKNAPDSLLIKQVPPVQIETPDKNAISIEVMPNPTNGRVNLRYILKEKQMSAIELFDLEGNKVKTCIAAQQMYEGTYTQSFDISELPDGIYICMLRSGDKTASTKVILTK